MLIRHPYHHWEIVIAGQLEIILIRPEPGDGVIVPGSPVTIALATRVAWSLAFWTDSRRMVAPSAKALACAAQSPMAKIHLPIEIGDRIANGEEDRDQPAAPGRGRHRAVRPVDAAPFCIFNPLATALIRSRRRSIIERSRDNQTVRDALG